MSENQQSETYERCVAAWAIEEFDFIDFTITANVKIEGLISGRSRQVDVLLENRYLQNPQARVIVEAKLHGRPVGIELVEAIEAKLRDVNAAHAVIVSSVGFTKPAVCRSEECIDLTLLEYDCLVDQYSMAFDECLMGNDCGLDLLWSVDKIDGAGPGWLMYKYRGSCRSFRTIALHATASMLKPGKRTCDWIIARARLIKP